MHDLERISVVFDEEDRALLLLTSLSDSYDHFVTTLIFGKTTLKFNEVVKDLQSHMNMKKGGSGSSSSSSEGLVANSGGGERSGWSRSQGAKNRGTGKSHSQDRDSWECFKCHKVGHIKKNCPELKNKRADAPREVAGVTT